MKPRTNVGLAQLFLLVLSIGSVHAQSERSDDPSRFLANPEVREAVERQTPLTSVPLQPYGPFYLVDVSINDKGPFKFVIDSGTTSTVLAASVAQELGLTQTAGSSLQLGSLQLGSAR